ncbi:hypothetical protein MGLY_10770 [Neomoorella glycerini]|uniref:Uncharacterized protein n=1 Tax=Neomoorella glycerini TaxID=55779 RepID=A0A6I5ZQ41_9FIRM|nr:hypothetical protein MGLY_10770 [Moorella glycerini]
MVKSGSEIDERRKHVHGLEHICASTVPIFTALNFDELQKVNNLIRKKEYKKGNVPSRRKLAASNYWKISTGIILRGLWSPPP